MKNRVNIKHSSPNGRASSKSGVDAGRLVGWKANPWLLGVSCRTSFGKSPFSVKKNRANKEKYYRGE